MSVSAFAHRDEVTRHQWARVQALLAEVIPANTFYSAKYKAAGFDARPSSLDDFCARGPLTEKRELIDDQRAHPPYGTNLTHPLNRYTRYHQTSGSTGAPLRWLDTAESWQAMLDQWKQVFAASNAAPGDCVFFAFSFGPFLGFWTAFEAATQSGMRCVPGGGMSSTARLRVLLDNGADVLCCTPTYAVRLGEVAREEGIDLAAARMKSIIVAGEPGGSLPETRKRIEALWPGATLYDHHGMTEVGPVTFACPRHAGVLRVMEGAYLAEILDPATAQPVTPGEAGELVLTSLHRAAMPLIRYRTGDLVRAHTDGEPLLGLSGGILGRTDDMLLVRGVNVYPAAVEEVVRGCGQIAEYQVHVDARPALPELKLTLEPAPDCTDGKALATRVEKALRDAFQLRVPVEVAAPGALPRYEMKARRWIRQG